MSHKHKKNTFLVGAQEFLFFLFFYISVTWWFLMYNIAALTNSLVWCNIKVVPINFLSNTSKSLWFHLCQTDLRHENIFVSIEKDILLSISIENDC